MFIVKKTAGARSPRASDLKYCLQEITAAGIPYTLTAIDEAGKELPPEEAGRRSSVVLRLIHRDRPAFALVFNERQSVSDFSAMGRKAAGFQIVYVDAFGVLRKGGRQRWSMGRIISMVLSFFEGVRLEAKARAALLASAGK